MNDLFPQFEEFMALLWTLRPNAVAVSLLNHPHHNRGQAIVLCDGPNHAVLYPSNSLPSGLVHAAQVKAWELKN